MQLLESSVIGLRSARHRLRSASFPAEVTLFPMVHVGEAAFYRSVVAAAAQHDVVLLEGIRSPYVGRLTRAYRWGQVERLGLIVQPKDDFATAPCRAVRADLSPEEFMAEWRRLPWWMRAVFPVIAAAFGLQLRLVGSRQMIARKLNQTDLRDRDEIFAPEPLIQLLLTARDQKLCAVLQAEIEAGAGSIAIIYGAAHMNAVLQFLYRFGGYRPIESDWMAVFEL